MHISQIYPCVTVTTVDELYFLAQIHKNLQFFNDEGLSLAGVKIDNIIKNTEYYKYLCSVGVQGVEKIEYTPDRNMFVDILDADKVNFKEKNNIEWVFDFDSEGKDINNQALFNGLAIRQRFVSFVANVLVRRVMFGVPKKLTLDFSKSQVVCMIKNMTNWKIDEVWSIYEKTEALSSWVDIILPNDRAEATLGYEAYMSNVIKLNNGAEYISAKDKQKLFLQRYKVGDIVFLYKRDNSKDIIQKEIVSCTIAQIMQVTKKGVRFNKYAINKSILDTKKFLQSLPNNLKDYFSCGYEYKTEVMSEMIDWLDLGVDTLIAKEENMLTYLDSSETVKMWFNDKNGDEVLLELTAQDGVYAMLKERNIEFDEKRFEELYFKNQKSVYKRFVLGIED